MIVLEIGFRAIGMKLLLCRKQGKVCGCGACYTSIVAGNTAYIIMKGGGAHAAHP